MFGSDLFDLMVAFLVFGAFVILANADKFINFFDFISDCAYETEKRISANILYVGLIVFVLINTALVYYNTYFLISFVINLLLLVFAYNLNFADKEKFNALEKSIFIAFPIIYVVHSSLPNLEYFGVNIDKLREKIVAVSIVTSLIIALYLLYISFSNTFYYLIVFAFHIVTIASFYLIFFLSRISDEDESENITSYYDLENLFSVFLFISIPATFFLYQILLDLFSKEIVEEKIEIVEVEETKLLESKWNSFWKIYRGRILVIHPLFLLSISFFSIFLFFMII